MSLMIISLFSKRSKAGIKEAHAFLTSDYVKEGMVDEAYMKANSTLKEFFTDDVYDDDDDDYDYIKFLT